jgi:signal transduction histidine kinase
VELCARIKGDRRWALLPVVILTAYTDLDARVAGLAAGADDFFSKPFELLELRARVGALRRALRLGGYLHDLGKIAVPDAVLLKPGPLTLSEREQVNRHPEVGADLVRGLRTLDDVRPIIRHHHERWDGGGYPDGLRGEAIPLGPGSCPSSTCTTRCGRPDPTRRRCRWPRRWTSSRPRRTRGPSSRASSPRSWRCCAMATSPDRGGAGRTVSERAGADPHLAILHTVAEAVNRSLDVAEVLHTALDALTNVTGHEISSLHLLSEDGRTLHLRGDRGLSAPLREINRVLVVGQGLIGRVASTGQSLNLRNVVESPHLLPAARAAVRQDGMRGFLCVPINSRGRRLGTLSLGRQISEPFAEREVALVEATADQIGTALDNARLHAETLRQLEELQRAQAQLVHIEKLSAVGELASGVAHEINNPLTTILGQAHLLLAHGETTPHVRSRLAIIADEASRAARIVQNLLLFARHYPPERRPCSLAEQVRRVLELKAYQLEQDQVEVLTDFEPCDPVWADENQIQQVILNLVQNAHQAMLSPVEERVLTVRVRPYGSAVTIEVLDTGHGIGPDAMPRLFDPFFTTKAPGEGSGLGLSVSYGIVAEHKGTLRGENRPDRPGAIFTVELPAGEAF